MYQLDLEMKLQGLGFGNTGVYRECPGREVVIRGWMVSKQIFGKMFGNYLPHVTSLAASAAIVLVPVSPAPAGTPQGFGVAQHHN